MNVEEVHAHLARRPVGVDEARNKNGGQEGVGFASEIVDAIRRFALHPQDHVKQTGTVKRAHVAFIAGNGGKAFRYPLQPRGES